MAKKKSASDFNMSQAIAEALTANPKASNQEVMAALVEKYPSAKINKNSFSVAFYNGRKKLGIGSTRKGKRGAKKVKMGRSASNTNFNALHSAAKFLNEVGSAEAALEAIKQVQSLQMR